LLVLECGRTSVRLAPPLTVSPEEIATAIRILSEAVAQVAGHPEQVHAEVTAAGALHEVEAAG
jgi:hypothetical protein